MSCYELNTQSYTSRQKCLRALPRVVLRADSEKAGGYLSFYMECGSGQSIMSSSQGCVILNVATKKRLTEPNPAQLATYTNNKTNVSSHNSCPYRTNNHTKCQSVSPQVRKVSRLCAESAVRLAQVSLVSALRGMFAGGGSEAVLELHSCCEAD